MLKRVNSHLKVKKPTFLQVQGLKTVSFVLVFQRSPLGNRRIGSQRQPSAHSTGVTRVQPFNAPLVLTSP